MADKLKEMYDAFMNGRQPHELDSLQLFQGGVTAGAVSMRSRAQKAAQAGKKPDNSVINAIGSLPDIPQE